MQSQFCRFGTLTSDEKVYYLTLNFNIRKLLHAKPSLNMVLYYCHLYCSLNISSVQALVPSKDGNRQIQSGNS